jgi:O-antigen ligase
MPFACGLCLALAYLRVDVLPFVLAGCSLVAICLLRSRALPLGLLDWSLLLTLVAEAANVFASRYPAAGVSPARVLTEAVVFYFLARLTLYTKHGRWITLVLISVGGLALGWFAGTQFNEHFRELQANGFSSTVAFRYGLILPPSPWVLGEWFTLVLMTLPFAFGAVLSLWLTGRRKLAAVSLLLTSATAAALALSCSRAVFWGVVLFFVGVFVVGAVYRVFPIRAAAVGAVGALGALTVLVFAENALYPGVLDAYAGGHTSQLRSTEGRLAIWRRSVDVFKLSPLWGVGSGNAPIFLAASADEDQTTGFASRTFSLPIQLLTEKGIVGTALYIAVLVLAGREARRKLRNPKVSPQMKGLTCCLVAGFAAVLFRELTYSSLLEHAATSMLFAMSLALVSVEEPA